MTLLTALYTQLLLFFKRHELARLSLVVFLFHLLFLLLLQWPSSIAEPIHKPMIIKTISLSPHAKIGNEYRPPKKKSVAKPDETKEKVAQEEQEDKKAEKKQEEKKKEEKEKAQPTKKLSQKKAAPAIDSKLLAKAKESLGKIEMEAKAAPKAHGEGAKSEVEGSSHGSDQPMITYEQALGQFLKLWLRLPEYGPVKVKVTLNSKGEVLQLQTLESASERNKLFVEEHLPKLTFPVVENPTRGQAERSLVLLLNNE